MVYLPETGRLSHYSFARLPLQFDAILHFDQTQAVVALEHGGAWDAEDLPEPCPSGVQQGPG